MPGDAVVLDVAIGTYPRTAALIDGTVRSPLVRLRFAELATANRAFAPMVRELRYHLSEMAIATFLQARSAGVPIVLLPVVLAARFQESALLCLRDGPIRDPADLQGRTIAVRAYSQTTAMWLRGILADRYGIAAGDVDWLTFEDAHVADIPDPANARRAAAEDTLTGALRAGRADAMIVGNEVPDDPGLRTVIADPGTAAKEFWDRYGMVPVNHMLTMRRDLASDRPDVAAAVVKMFRDAAAAIPPGEPDGYPIRREPIARAVELAHRFTAAQDMLGPSSAGTSAWEGTPPGVWEHA